MNVELLAGPAALAIGASLAVVALWKNHVKKDDVDAQTIRTLTETVRLFPDALKDLTAVVLDSSERERNRVKTSRAGDR